MSNEIFEAVKQLSHSKGIDVERVIAALEEAIAAAAKRDSRTEDDVVVCFDRQTGQIEAFRRLTIVDDVVDEALEIDLEDARELKPDSQLGDQLLFPRSTADLGRIAAQQAKQVIYQKVREAERENIFSEYRARVGELLTGTVKRFEKGDLVVDLGRTEALLPRREQSRVERYSIGDRVRAVIVKVDEVAKGPQVVLSRTAPELLVKLFEMEVPEIYEGTVKIMGCVREPGERAKVAVRSENRDIDPVGACVGIKGSRVQAIIRELRGEKIDIVPWSQDATQYLMNALNPARVNRVTIGDERQRTVEVSVDDDQLSLAIGKKGQNVRLASRLTGWRIEVHGERERREAAEREIRVLASAPQALQQIPGIDADKAQALMEFGVRTWEEFLDTEPRAIMELLGIEDTVMDAMIEAADQLETEREEREKQDAAKAAARMVEEAARAAAEAREAALASAAADAAGEAETATDAAAGVVTAEESSGDAPVVGASGTEGQA